MNDLVFFLNKAVFSGLIIGSIYAMGAIGLTLIFGILRFAHFAHGDLMTLGAFVTLILTALLAGVGVAAPVPLAFLAMIPAMAITAVLAIGLDRMFYKPLREAGARPVVLVMASVGVALMLQGEKVAEGTGKSKKEAEQNAAREAFFCLTADNENL